MELRLEGMAGNVIISLYEKLEGIKEPRDPRGRKYEMPYILTLIIIGFLIGKTDFVNMEHVFKLRQNEIKSIFGKKYRGIPSHDTFSRVMRLIEENEMTYAILDWMSAIVHNKGAHIAIDGKGVRAAAEKVRKQETPYVINAIHAGYKFVIGQLKIDEKTNEITGIPDLIRLLDIKDTVITIDAIGTQTAIANKILAQGGHFVLPVKQNQGNTQDAISLYMNDLIMEHEEKKINPLYESNYKEPLLLYEDNEKSHGRYEHRTYYISYETKCLEGLNFKKVSAIGFVVRDRKKPQKDKEGNIIGYEECTDRIAYIMDQKLSVQEFAGFVRNHWRIENSLHWVLDNTFKEDRSTAKKGNAIGNISFLRKVAYNIIRIYKMKCSDKAFEYVQDEFSNNINLIKGYVIDGIESLY